MWRQVAKGQHIPIGFVFSSNLIERAMDSSSQSNDFVVGNCIGCNGLVRVPSNTKASVRVRCPRCGESYLLSAILDHDIPALEVVDEPIEDTAQTGGVDVDTGAKYQPVTEQENGRFVVPSYLAKAAERKPRRRSGSRESEFQPGAKHLALGPGIMAPGHYAHSRIRTWSVLGSENQFGL